MRRLPLFSQRAPAREVYMIRSRYSVGRPVAFSASALALCEPWACVEDAYVDTQRQKLKADGKMLVASRPQ